MSDQLTLDLAPLVTPDYAPDLTPSQRFAEFHSQNPHVADLLERLAADWFAAGNSKVGVKALTEQARWASGLATTSEPWRINNTHVAFYADLLIQRNPDWETRIDRRRRTAE